MVVYKDSDHTYSYAGKKYTSVTTLIGNLKPYTDWDDIAYKYVAKRTDEEIILDLAKKWSLTPEEIVVKFGSSFNADLIREIWKSAGSRATTGGSNYHDWREIQASGGANTVFNPIVDDTKVGINLKEIKPNHTYLEMMLYSHSARVSGQADKIIIKEKTSVVRDYKVVNKELVPEVKGYWDNKKKKTVIKKFKSPIKHVPISSYWEYALQLSLYGYMLETYGYPPEELIIEQVLTEWIYEKDLGGQLVVQTDPQIGKVRVVIEVQEVKLPYLRKEAKALLKR